MKRVTKRRLMLLLKSVFVIALFSVMVFNMYSAKAVDKKDYSSFNWDKFKEENLDNWKEYCKDSYNSQDKDEQEKCVEELSNSLEKLYTKLYKILAKYQNNGSNSLYINDQVILWTIFYGQFLSQSSEASSYINSYIKEKKDMYKQWPSGYFGFVIDENPPEEDDDVVPKYTRSFANYYEKESDTLKVLIRNAVGYYTKCYGVTGDPKVTTLDDGSTRTYCEDSDSIVVDDVPKEGTKCVRVLDSTEMGFWKFFVSRMAHDEELNIFMRVLFLGFTTEDEHYDMCMEHKGEEIFESVHYIYEDEPHESYKMYFDFLKENAYFDGKSNLQYYFRKVLKAADVDCLRNETCDNSLEAKGEEEYLKYDEQLQEARLEIIYDILKILDDLGIGIEYGNFTPESELIPGGGEEDRTAYYWPIGSDTTEVRDGVTYADGEPASKGVLSYFGERKSDVTGKMEYHTGIDIAGIDGTTNVIAVEKGEVISALNNCSVGDYECNEGYGNMIVISHSDGNYTVYGLLNSIDSAVKVGSTVQKGQLIGKVGKTGRTKVSALHFEIRKDGNSTNEAIDPLTIISSSKPRPSGYVNGDFSMRKTTLTREEFISGLVRYCNTHTCRADELGYFANNAGLVYDLSVANGLNPEFTVVRAISEGFSPNKQDPSLHNYWGIGCTNGGGLSACHGYSSFEDGIVNGLAKMGIVKKYETALQLFTEGHYGYIGDYWINPGSWSDGGCKYFPYIKQYYSNPTRVKEVEPVCAPSRNCTSGCMPTNDEDQEAYGLYNISSMSKSRYNIWGL